MLGTGVDYRVLRSRSTFYTALMRLLSIDLTEDDDAFDAFMAPIGRTVYFYFVYF